MEVLGAIYKELPSRQVNLFEMDKVSLDVYHQNLTVGRLLERGQVLQLDTHLFLGCL